ncbi:hypothetical protein AVEN_143594-1 [Araneus ventricosus]|uniref:Uncharacterized protein n=1 Tax=Araneus ventricosus TaxID=182803 RepID=A0A4Y2ANG6_ARAVE|nr:hypothetical protein AVEN_143594-1 [Araneus ventricosus]
MQRVPPSTEREAHCSSTGSDAFSALNRPLLTFNSEEGVSVAFFVYSPKCSRSSLVYIQSSVVEEPFRLRSMKILGIDVKISEAFK